MTKIKLGTFFDIPVYLHWTLLFLIPMALTSPTPLASGINMFVAFFCVLLHEFGHALAAKQAGYRVPSITLMILGGVASIQSFGKNPHKDLYVTIMGPVVTLALCLVSFLGIMLFPFLKNFFALVFLINAALFVFNILPIHPMDGGRLLKDTCRLYFDNSTARKITTIVGVTTAIIVCFAFLWFKMFFAAFVIAVTGVINFLAGYKKLDI